MVLAAPVALGALAALLIGDVAAAHDPITWFSSGGLIGFLLYFVGYAIPTRKWVPGDLYDEAMKNAEIRVADAQKREKEWRELALSGTDLAKRQLSVTEAALAMSSGTG